MSQNLIVPFLGLRLGPLHWAEPDTFDEAVTITALLDGLHARFYAKSASTAATTFTAPALCPATTATNAVPASDSAGTTNPTSVAATTYPVSTVINSAFAAAFQSSASHPAAKKAKTGVAATSKEVDEASSMKLTSFFHPKS